MNSEKAQLLFRKYPDFAESFKRKFGKFSNILLGSDYKSINCVDLEMLKTISGLNEELLPVTKACSEYKSEKNTNTWNEEPVMSLIVKRGEVATLWAGSTYHYKEIKTEEGGKIDIKGDFTFIKSSGDCVINGELNSTAKLSIASSRGVINVETPDGKIINYTQNIAIGGRGGDGGMGSTSGCVGEKGEDSQMTTDKYGRMWSRGGGGGGSPGGNGGSLFLNKPPESINTKFIYNGGTDGEAGGDGINGIIDII